MESTKNRCTELESETERLTSALKTVQTEKDEVSQKVLSLQKEKSSLTTEREGLLRKVEDALHAPTLEVINTIIVQDKSIFHFLELMSLHPHQAKTTNIYELRILSRSD